MREDHLWRQLPWRFTEHRKLTPTSYSIILLRFVNGCSAFCVNLHILNRINYYHFISSKQEMVSFFTDFYPLRYNDIWDLDKNFTLYLPFRGFTYPFESKVGLNLRYRMLLLIRFNKQTKIMQLNHRTTECSPEKYENFISVMQ